MSRALTDDVTQADKFLDALLVDVFQDSSQRWQIGVYIADDGNRLHVRRFNQPASRTA